MPIVIAVLFFGGVGILWIVIDYLRFNRYLKKSLQKASYARFL